MIIKPPAIFIVLKSLNYGRWFRYLKSLNYGRWFRYLKSLNYGRWFRYLKVMNKTLPSMISNMKIFFMSVRKSRNRYRRSVFDEKFYQIYGY